MCTCHIHTSPAVNGIGLLVVVATVVCMMSIGIIISLVCRYKPYNTVTFSGHQVNLLNGETRDTDHYTVLRLCLSLFQVLFQTKDSAGWCSMN